MADTDKPETPQNVEKPKVGVEGLKTPEAGDRKKADKGVKSPPSAGSSRSHRPHSSRSGSHRERHGGHKDRDRDHHRSGDRDRDRHARRHGDRKDDERNHRSDRHRSDRKDGDKDGHRSERRTSERKEEEKSQGGAERRISERDAEAKRRGRRNGGETATPGASSVTDSAGSRRSARPSAGSASGLPGAPLTKEERMSRRNEEEHEAKRRAKEGRSSGNRPGSSVAGTAASRGPSDQEAKHRAKEGRTGIPSAPGVAPSRGSDDIMTREKNKMKMQMHGNRPGVSTSRAKDNKKSLEKVKLDYDNNKSSEPATADEAPDATVGGEVAVEAVAIDEGAEEDERMRQLEEQNRTLAERMERMMTPAPNNNAAEERRIQTEKDAQEEQRKRIEELQKKKKQRNICILIVLFLIAGGGIAAYFLTKSDDAVVVPKEIPKDVVNTSAPAAPPVDGTPTPTALEVSEGPSSPPTAAAYDPPSLEDCIRISSGLPIQGQEDLHTSPFQMEFDLTIKDANLSTDTWVPAFKRGIDQILIPALAGCLISTNRRLAKLDNDELLSQTRGLRKMESAKLEQTPVRKLQNVVSPIRYVIANANSQINPPRDVTDNCEIKRNGCNNVKVVMELFLKGEERGFNIITLIAQVLQSLAGIDDSMNRQLATNEEQRHHRKLLRNILRLDDEIFDIIEYRGIRGLDPTTSPSVSPSQAPSADPTANPTGVPSVSPTSGPTVKPTPGPSPAPTPGPTGQPTPNPTPGPTEQPTPGPTPEPTPWPTPAPTQNPTPFPTPQPNPLPTPPPNPLPTPPPFPQPTLFATSWPTPWGSVSGTYYGTPSYTGNPYSPSPSSCPGGFIEDTSFRDSGNDPCSWYITADSPGCPNTGSQYPGTCDVVGQCYAQDRCCVCLNTPGCVDDPTFKDGSNDGCDWYTTYDPSCQRGTQYGGTCSTGTRECYAADVCCHCQ